LRAAREIETTQDNIQDWLELDEGDPGFQLQRGRTCHSDIVFIFISTTYIIKFSIYLFSKFFFSFRASFCSINPDYRSIKMTSPPN
jgi:hypothetical protein